MKKLIALAVFLIMAISAMPAISADLILDTKVKQAVTKLDKHGKEYTRIIISEVKELNGIKYTTDSTVMCFGDTVTKAKTLKTGDAIKAVVGTNEYQGRTGYNLISFVSPVQAAKQ